MIDIDQQISDLCLKLHEWQEKHCPDREVFIVVLVRELSAYLSFYGEDAGKKVLKTLSIVMARDAMAFEKFVSRQEVGHA